MKNYLPALFLFITYSYSEAQITFQKTFGGINDDAAYSVQQTADGGYIMAGYTRSFGADSADVYLIRTDANGDTLWTKTFGGTDHDNASFVRQTADGGYIITGRTMSFGSVLQDIYLIRTDANGNSLWTKTFGGIDFDVAYFVQQTTDGGYIIGGSTASYGAGSVDFYLIKTDTNGDSLWTKTYGGPALEDLFSMQQTSDGGYIITGSTLDSSMNYDKVHLIKTDANGDTLWTKTFGGTDEDLPTFVVQTTDGGYIITGITSSFGSGSFDEFLIKTDSTGNVLWSKTFGGADVEYGWFVQQTTDGGYIITGLTESFGAGNADIYLVKTDGNGNTLWTKTFGGPSNDYGYSIQQTGDGGYIIAGWTESFGAANYDIYIIKTDANGNSGCNEGATTTLVTAPVIQLTHPATIVSSGGIVGTPATLVGSGGIAGTLCTTVGIKEPVINNPVLISPNPSTGNFIISFEKKIIKGHVEISDIFGKNVYAENIFSESKKEIRQKNISGGIYFVKMFDGEKYYCRKIIIEQN